MCAIRRFRKKEKHAEKKIKKTKVNNSSNNNKKQKRIQWKLKYHCWGQRASEPKSQRASVHLLTHAHTLAHWSHILCMRLFVIILTFPPFCRRWRRSPISHLIQFVYSVGFRWDVCAVSHHFHKLHMLDCSWNGMRTIFRVSVSEWVRVECMQLIWHSTPEYISSELTNNTIFIAGFFSLLPHVETFCIRCMRLLANKMIYRMLKLTNTTRMVRRKRKNDFFPQIERWIRLGNHLTILERYCH